MMINEKNGDRIQLVCTGGMTFLGEFFLREEVEKEGGVVVMAAVSQPQRRRAGLLQHQRSGHLLLPRGFKRWMCPECCRAVGRRGSHSKERPQKAKITQPLRLLALDFWGVGVVFVASRLEWSLCDVLEN